MRVGLVVKVVTDKKIGFIRSEDLREDVFFHFSKVDKAGLAELQEGEEVEYEIDELAKIENLRLQATLVRRTRRPLSYRLTPGAAPHLKAHHHPKARRKRPQWRGRDDAGTVGDSDPHDDSNEPGPT